jgi:soluble lytic murein transglycosylase-like protein
MSDSWKSAGQGPIYVPLLNAAEIKYSIPTDLLARIAFQESSFRPGVINGAIRSSANCVGLMQLNPVYYPNAGKDPVVDIDDAADLLMNLYTRFRDWQVAVAAYNWGGGNVHHEYAIDADKYVLADMPDQTQNYVKNVFTDVPISGALLS